MKRLEKIAVPCLKDLLQEDLLVMLGHRDPLAIDECFS